MRRSIAKVALFSLVAIGPATALADQPGADWISMEQVREKLAAAGYTQVDELEADDGHWEGEGIKNGQRMDFHVDPHTGAFTKEEIDK